MPKENSQTILQSAKRIHKQQIASAAKFALVLVVASALYFVWQSEYRYGFIADYVTNIGEQKEQYLSDNTQIYLNTHTAIDEAFDTKQRLVRLHFGEMQIHTTKENRKSKQPFIVQTKYGTLEALGTIFNVTQLDNQTCVAVIQSTVRIKAKQLAPMIIKENEQICFSENSYQPKQKVNINTSTWQNGLFSAYDLPLEQFVEEMNHYHKDYTNLGGNISNVRVSGAYPIENIPRTLHILQQTYPLAVTTHFNGYMINIGKPIKRQ